MIFDIGSKGDKKVRILVLVFGGMRLLDRIMISMGGEVGHCILAHLFSLLGQ